MTPKYNKQITRQVLLLGLLLGPAGLAPFARAQQLDRLPARIDSRQRMILPGARNLRIEKLASEGPVEDTMRVSGLTFRFQPTSQQSAELEKLLQDQQDPKR